MGGGQAQLKASGRRKGPSHPFGRAGGWVEHPLVRPGAVDARAFEIAIAEGCLRASTLVVVPPTLGPLAVGPLVAAERLRQAGGFVLALAPSPSLARALSERFTGTFAPSAAAKVVLLRASTKKGAREAAYREAWVVATGVEAAAADIEAGRVDLARCSLLVVEGAERALGRTAYLGVARALRRDRPGALVLALSVSADRRRAAAIMDLLGLQRLERRAPEDSDVAPYLAAIDVDVLEVELTPELREVQAVLEAELAPLAAHLVRLGALAPAPVRYVGESELQRAGEVLRKRHGDQPEVFFEAAQAHQQATLLVMALRLAEEAGAQPLGDFLDSLAKGPGATRAERSLAARAGVKKALALARRQGAGATPKMERLASILQGLARDRPSARALVVAPRGRPAAQIADALARPPPVGPGISALIYGQPGASEKGARVVIAPSILDVGPGAAAYEVVVLFEAAPSELLALRGLPGPSHGRARRAIVLVTSDARDEGALAAAEPHGRGGGARIRLLKAESSSPWLAKGPNRKLPLEVPGPAAPGPLRGGGGR